MSVLEQLAAFVATARPDELPALDQAILRRHLTDVVVSRIAGARTGEGRALAGLDGAGTTASGIAALAASVRLTEIDDIHIGSCTTVSSVSVPVALALAAQGDAEPERVLGAIWAGTELLVRLGKAIDGASVLYQGIWPTRTGAPLAAAAVACRMWGLDEAKTAHALSLALMMTPARIARFTGALSGRWVLFAAAVGDGIRAAEAARAGFSGDPTLLDGSWLANNLGVPVDLSRLTVDLGSSASIYPELSLKPFCTSRQALSATDAMRGLLADGLDPTTIEAVRVRVPTAYAAMISTRLDPKVRATSYVSVGAQMALAAFAPEHLYDVDRATILEDGRVQWLAGLVRVEADPALDSYFPKQWPAEVEVKTASGTHQARVLDALGDPGRRLDDAALETKAASVLAHLGMKDRAPHLMALGRAAATDAAACHALANAFVNASC